MVIEKFNIDSPVKSQRSDDSLAALPVLGQVATWPTRVSARAGSQAFYEVVNMFCSKVINSIPI